MSFLTIGRKTCQIWQSTVQSSVLATGNSESAGIIHGFWTGGSAIDIMGDMKPLLTVPDLKKAAAAFAKSESRHGEPTIFGVTDGKAARTYLEHKFLQYLDRRCRFGPGNSAKGIDLPGANVDIKTTSIRQPQSSCPYKSARQKIFGLGYSLLIFVYDKSDDQAARTARLDIQHVIFVEAGQTADYQMTFGLNAILDSNGNEDDLVAFMLDRLLPVDEIEAGKIAKEILKSRPRVGYLTISNALQWRLQYSRVIEQAGSVKGVERIR